MFDSWLDLAKWASSQYEWVFTKILSWIASKILPEIPPFLTDWAGYAGIVSGYVFTAIMTLMTIVALFIIGGYAVSLVVQKVDGGRISDVLARRKILMAVGYGAYLFFYVAFGSFYLPLMILFLLAMIFFFPWGAFIAGIGLLGSILGIWAFISKN